MSIIVSISSSSVFQRRSTYSASLSGSDTADILQALVFMPCPRGEISRPPQIVSNSVDFPPWNSPTRTISKLLRLSLETASLSSLRASADKSLAVSRMPSMSFIRSLRFFSYTRGVIFPSSAIFCSSCSADLATGLAEILVFSTSSASQGNGIAESRHFTASFPFCSSNVGRTSLRRDSRNSLIFPESTMAATTSEVFASSPFFIRLCPSRSLSSSPPDTPSSIAIRNENVASTCIGMRSSPDPTSIFEEKGTSKRSGETWYTPL